MSLFANLNLDDKPLASFPNLRTRDVALLESSVASMYGSVHFDIGRDRERFFAVSNRLRLDAIGLSYAMHGTSIGIAVKETQYYAHLFSVAGNAVARTLAGDIEINESQSYICSDGDVVNLKYAADFEQLVVRYDTSKIRNKLLLLTGDNRAEYVRFEPASNADGPAGGLEAQLIRRLVKLCEQEEFPYIAASELEQSIIMAFLLGNRHNLSALLTTRPAAVAPWQVRRAEAFIERNWSRPLLMEDVAAACDTSVRNLFYTFKHSRGHTPREFLRKVRLDRAHEMLTNPTQEMSVTDVALICGFANAGHFAKHFRQQFNEVPSVTLNRAKSKRF